MRDKKCWQKLPFLFQLYKSGGGYVNGTIDILKTLVSLQVSSVIPFFERFYKGFCGLGDSTEPLATS